MDVGRRTGGRSGVVAGSVWESRMKIDEVRGGIKVFNGEEGSEESEVGTTTRLKKVQITGGVAGGRRKTWKSEGSDGFEKTLILIARGEADLLSDCNEKCTELSASAEELKKNTVQVRKLRSEGNRKMISAIDEIEGSPIQTRTSRSDFVKGSGESIEKIEKNQLQNRRLKPDSLRMMKMNKSDGSFSRPGARINENSKAKSENNSLIEKIQPEITSNGGEETSKEFGMGEETRTSKSRINEEEEEEEDGDAYEETYGGDAEDESEIEIEKNKIEIKRIDKPASNSIIREVRKLHQASEKSIPTTVTARQSPSIQKHSRLHQNLSKPPPNSDKRNTYPENQDDLQNLGSDEHNSFPDAHCKLQRMLDLVMWRDVSRSAFVFGIGTFVIISFSCTKEINVSFISAISYLGLVYLAAIFFYRSIVSRGVADVDDDDRHVIGEDEAIWFVKLILPYLNEFLLKLRALFCGDPDTTIKLAGLLLVFAWCGNSITISRVAKWGFFGVFTVPKISASYSSHLTLFAKFWTSRFRDAWNSCSHKNGVTIAAFIVIWRSTSAVARIWAAFVLFVALRCCQQPVKDDALIEDKLRLHHRSPITPEAPR